MLIVALILGASSCRTLINSEDLSDQATKARIETLLRDHRDLDIKHITVDVTAGAATISGIAPNGDQVRIIRHLTAGVRGVDRVLNNLIIQE